MTRVVEQRGLKHTDESEGIFSYLPTLQHRQGKDYKLPIRYKSYIIVNMTKGRFDKTIRFCDSFEEADKIDEEYYASLTPDQRINIGLELLSMFYEAYPRFERIYRTAELGECPVSSDWRVGI